jgi:hypothetical protein
MENTIFLDPHEFKFVTSYRQFKAALTPRGYVRFVNYRPDRAYQWVCDECCKRIPLGQQEKHAKDHR